MAVTVQIDAVVLSPSDIYRGAWRSLLASMSFINCVETVATVSEIELPLEERPPRIVLVDAPGAEHRIALQLGRSYQRYYAFFVVNDYALSTILPLLKLGVSGFMARDDSVSELNHAFITTVKGQISLPSNVANQAMTELANEHRRHLAMPGDLTRREAEVLQLLADGNSNKDIAQSLFLSVRTVEAHLHNLYGKLAVNTRTEAALWAVRNGLASFV